MHFNENPGKLQLRGGDVGGGVLERRGDGGSSGDHHHSSPPPCPPSGSLFFKAGSPLLSVPKFVQYF